MTFPFPRLPFVERLVGILLFLAAANFLLVLITGGYAFAVGPFRVSERHLWNPLFFLLSFAAAKVWLRGKRLGIPAAVRLRSPLLLFLIVVFIYSLNKSTLGSGDTLPARYLPLSILREFNFDLDEFPFLYEPGFPYFLQKSNGHIISSYPPWAAVLALPVYLLPVLGGLSPQSHLLPDLEKLSASLITALSVVILYFALRRMTQERVAWLIALVYAFGTSSFSTSSQGLWQHGPSQLFLALTIYYLVRGLEEPKFSAYAGFALGGAVICRPVNILIALPIGIYILHKRYDQIIGFLLAASPPFLLFMAYNLHYFGSPFTTGFAGGVVNLYSFLKAPSAVLSTPLLEGLTGILASPGRGLLIYSPIFLFSFVGMAMVWKEPSHVLLRYLSFAPLPLSLLTGKWMNWWGGGSYGPRMLADITPILCLYLYPPLERFKAKAFHKCVIAGLSALSAGLHMLGAFSDGSWNALGPDSHPEILWYWVDSPPIYYVRKALGVKPVTVAIRVVEHTGGDFEQLLAKQLKTAGDSTHLSIATDRPRYRRSDVLNMTVGLVNFESSGPADAYLALTWPDGRLFFWDGHEFSLYTSRRWVPLVRGSRLVKGVRVANHPLLSLKLIDMPSGSYTWYLVVTESSAATVIAKAQATFTLEP